jgi:hypothetical protein
MADKRPKAFHVILLEDHAARVRCITGKSNVVYAGSHQGCSCGFYLESKKEFEEILESLAELPQSILDATDADWKLRREEIGRLREYLVEASKAGPVEMLSVWSEIKQPTKTIHVRASELGGTDGFKLEDDTLYVFG